MEDYLEPIPSQQEAESTEGIQNEQKTPKRIIIKYQTTGIFEDISEKDKSVSSENKAR